VIVTRVALYIGARALSGADQAAPAGR